MQIFKKVFGNFSFYLMAVSFTVLLMGNRANAQQLTYKNDSTGYVAVVEDDADLLTDSQERNLLEQISELTIYGNSAFITIDVNYMDVESWSNDKMHSLFGYQSSTIFVIDMDNRKVCVMSDGANYSVITNSKADVICDNIYGYASDGDYYGCACEAFDEIGTLLSGGRIAMPMKHITNALFALVCSLLVCYFILDRTSRAHKRSDKELLKFADKIFGYSKIDATFINETKKYNPQSSSSSGGGGGGGGGSSGGGGSHSF